MKCNVCSHLLLTLAVMSVALAGVEYSSSRHSRTLSSNLHKGLGESGKEDHGLRVVSMQAPRGMDHLGLGKEKRRVEETGQKKITQDSEQKPSPQELARLSKLMAQNIHSLNVIVLPGVSELASKAEKHFQAYDQNQAHFQDKKTLKTFSRLNGYLPRMLDLHWKLDRAYIELHISHTDELDALGIIYHQQRMDRYILHMAKDVKTMTLPPANEDGKATRRLVTAQTHLALELVYYLSTTVQMFLEVQRGCDSPYGYPRAFVDFKYSPDPYIRSRRWLSMVRDVAMEAPKVLKDKLARTLFQWKLQVSSGNRKCSKEMIEWYQQEGRMMVKGLKEMLAHTRPMLDACDQFVHKLDTYTHGMTRREWRRVGRDDSFSRRGLNGE
ncbi:hypothetical protein BJ684DRAFT_16226 [Piptocephalis cylindrospora]|uniref:Uncharacterized protein n=1 Tax=Piptocephalis cylindrospora TaxID=1907219 RepID=A0A4P9Y3Y5_9FUNG|nr:hypothetical protein BJ684DRAFT_16226 [Piptocephalis cylindrospora]|eukprot:RKP13362.1 hypothetical protein BJ684DRAFT_16226 [Piptocephalis cylindrospora]